MLVELCEGVSNEELPAALSGLLADSAHVRAAALAALPSQPGLEAGQCPADDAVTAVLWLACNDPSSGTPTQSLALKFGMSEKDSLDILYMLDFSICYRVIMGPPDVHGDADYAEKRLACVACLSMYGGMMCQARCLPCRQRCGGLEPVGVCGMPAAAHVHGRPHAVPGSLQRRHPWRRCRSSCRGPGGAILRHNCIFQLVLAHAGVQALSILSHDPGETFITIPILREAPSCESGCSTSPQRDDESQAGKASCVQRAKAVGQHHHQQHRQHRQRWHHQIRFTERYASSQISSNTSSCMWIAAAGTPREHGPRAGAAADAGRGPQHGCARRDGGGTACAGAVAGRGAREPCRTVV